MARGKRQAYKPRRDYGRAIAFFLCVLFAIVGVVPLTVGLLVRTNAVRAWAARRTSEVLAGELGLSAHYAVEVQAWPLMIALRDVTIDASDGGSPFLQVERVTVRPRPFSLLAGKIDAGDVEVLGPRVRAVVADGAIKNLRYKLPESTPEQTKEKTEPPIASVAITDAHIDATVDGTRVLASELDVDVSAEEASAFEVAVRAGTTTVTRTHPVPGREDYEDAVDEDVLCRFDARVRVDDRGVLVRRLTLQGSADFDPDPGTAPSCTLEEGDWRGFEVRLGAVRIGFPTPSRPLTANGRVHAKLPLAMVHRFAKVPHATGAVELDLEGDFDGKEPMPRVAGHVTLVSPGIDGKLFAHRFDADVSTTTGAIEVKNGLAAWADGKVKISWAKIDPFADGVPMQTGPIDIEGIEFHALLRDLGVHPRAHVAWSIREGRYEHFNGKLSPVALEGPLSVKTTGFEIFNKPVIDPTRGHMMGVKEGTVRGTFKVTPTAVVLQGFSVDTPRSHVVATVSLAYRSVLDIEVAPESHVDLADIDPLIQIPIGGKLTMKAGVHGPFDHPKIAADISVSGFQFGGFSVGDIESAKVAFEPMVLEFADTHLRHGQSRIRAPLTRIAFDKGADVLVDADVDTHDPPNLTLHDFFEVFKFDKDPRFADMAALTSGKARVHYALGGPEDRCGGGFLDVRAQTEVSDVSLFGEHYDDGSMDMDFVWDDQAAGAAGMRVDLHSGTLRKGTGSILATATIRHGGVVQGSAVATGIPLGKLDVMGGLGKMLDGSVSMVADLRGTVSELEAIADVNVSRVRIGASTLPPSHLRVAMEPVHEVAKHPPIKTHCGNDRAGTFDMAEWEKDTSAGVFRIEGGLFDKQIGIEDVTITRQKHKVMKGKIAVRALDLGTLSNMIPGLAFSGTPPKGNLTATLDVKNLPFDAPKHGDMSLVIDSLQLDRDKNEVSLAQASGEIKLVEDELTVPDLRIRGRTASGLQAVFVAGGKVHEVMSRPELDMNLRVEPIDLARLSAEIASVERASGSVDAELHVTGPPAAIRYSGSAHLRKGELGFKGSPLALSEAHADIEVGGGEVRLKNASAHIGGGSVDVTGRMPVKGTELGTLSATIAAHHVKLPVADGVNLTADADLEATFRPGATPAQGQRNLPDVKGTVSLTSFSYTRPIALSLSLSAIGRPQRTSVENYDPADDVVNFHLTVVSPKPLRFTNNLVDMQLEVVDPGLMLAGTNQRFGARGILRILPESKLTLRNNEFDVREGYVRFDDISRIAPKVDLRAQTEYRRYAATTQETPGATPTDTGSPSGSSSNAASGATGSTTAQSGLWRITLRAHGDADDLKVTLASDPPLSQEDIVLLLTVGMTRAEVDRSTASLGETVGLEALSALTGADKAVKSVVPLIDEFRFGTGYSSKTARMEPTVTIGKRIGERVRASVTTGITENREVRSNIEWKLNSKMSVQGSYDNANDVSSSLFGNVGIDLRWHLEFE